MKLAKFWARDEGEAVDPDGNRIAVVARGWSNESVEAARNVARDVANRVAGRLAGVEPAHSYLYGDRPLPEPVVREFSNALVTRNVYGSLVLNTNELMFVDIDREAPAPHSGLASGLRSLFGKSEPPPARVEDPVVAEIRRIADANRLSARIYKTAAGYRALITNGIFDPGSARSEQLLRQFGSDPLYIRLCGMQQSFRARLSPKPWRCGQPIPPVAFPYETAKEQRTFQAWESAYSAVIPAYATCNYVTSVGSGGTDSRFESLIEFHDSETKAASGLPLA